MGFEPSPQQRAIFDFVATGSGHGLVVARAGTGKTTTILEALNYLPPHASVLCCAFNVRIRDKLRDSAPEGVTVRTLHQLGRDTLRSFGDFRKFRHDEDDKKAQRMAVAAIRGSRFDPEAPESHEDAKTIHDEVVHLVATGARLVKATLTTTRDDLINLVHEHDLCPSYIEEANEIAEYIAAAVRNSLAAWPVTDFDDEVWLPVHYGLGLRQFDYVFIDEAQDLTLAQIRLALSAAHEHGRIIAIGDPAQAIYRWRGADRDPFDRLKTELKATVLPLSVSYRCPQAVIRLAQKTVEDIEAHTDAPEGRVVPIKLGDMLTTIQPGDFLLSRTNAPLAQLGLDLSRNGVPTRVVGASDIGNMLINLARRSRRKTCGALSEWLDTYVEKEQERLAGRKMAQQYAEDKAETLKSFMDHDNQPVTDLIARITRFYDEQRTSRRAVILSTVHRLKGDEADRVFVLEETFFLSRGDPEEEQNIWYVAVTRAKQSLYRVTELYRRKEQKE